MKFIPSIRPVIAGVMMITLTSVSAGDPKKRGDVMARDLDYFALENLGHVGIYDGNEVLECLNEVNPIQKNPLKSFKSQSKFWGARYIPGKHDFRKVIAKGWAQRNYEPSFTISPVPTIGRHVNKRVWNASTKKWENRTVLVPAKFRCDAFVNYSFKAGIGYKLANGEITPSIVYRNCPKAR
jgi:hypothetical protein